MTSQQEYVDGQMASGRDERGFEGLTAEKLRSGHGSELRHSLGQVWGFATLIFILSSAFFVFATGVTAMMLPLSLVALGIGLIGTLRLLATRHRSA